MIQTKLLDMLNVKCKEAYRVAYFILKMVLKNLRWVFFGPLSKVQAGYTPDKKVMMAWSSPSQQSHVDT